jgi:hypothetical protein
MLDQESMTARARATTRIPFRADNEILIIMFCNLPVKFARCNPILECCFLLFYFDYSALLFDP